MSINRRRKILTIPEELRIPFAVARGKARKEFVELQEKLYVYRDKNSTEEIKEDFEFYGPYGTDEGYRVISDMPGIHNNSFEHIINVDKGEIIGTSNENTNKKFYQSDMAFEHIQLVLGELGRIFKDFTLTRWIGRTIFEDDTLKTMQLFLDKEEGSDQYKEEQAFEENSDGFWAFLGTPLGSAKWLLPVQHPKDLKGRKPIRVIVRIRERKIICEYG